MIKRLEAIHTEPFNETTDLMAELCNDVYEGIELLADTDEVEIAGTKYLNHDEQKEALSILLASPFDKGRAIKYLPAMYPSFEIASTLLERIQDSYYFENHVQEEAVEEEYVSPYSKFTKDQLIAIVRELGNLLGTYPIDVYKAWDYIEEALGIEESSSIADEEELFPMFCRSDVMAQIEGISQYLENL